MLTPEYIERLGDSIFPLLADFQAELLADVAKKIYDLGDIDDELAWQIAKLEVVASNRDYIRRKIAQVTGKTDKEIERIFESAAMQSFDADMQRYTAAYKAGSIAKPGLNTLAILQSQRVLEAAVRNAQGQARNLTGTLLNSNYNFVRTLDRMHLNVTSGGMSTQQASRSALRDMIQFATSVIFPSGRRDQIDVAIARAVRTGAAQTAGTLSMMNFEMMGGNLVQTTAHAGARLSHEPWQGETFWVKTPDDRFGNFYWVTGYGTPEGLQGPNCRHDFYPVFDGLDDLTKQPAPQNPAGVSNEEFYKATQKARLYERDLRTLKRERNAYYAAGDEEMVRRYAERISEKQTGYAEHLAKYGLTARAERTVAYNYRMSGLFNLTDSDNITIKKIREYIGSSAYPKDIRVGQQEKHIVGTKNYEQYEEKLKKIKQFGPSRLSISIDEAQKLVNEYAGTGKVQLNKNGVWIKQEVITNSNFIVGTAVNNYTGVEAETTVFKIHYSKKGTHIVPDYPSKKR